MGEDHDHFIAFEGRKKVDAAVGVLDQLDNSGRESARIRTGGVCYHRQRGIADELRRRTAAPGSGFFDYFPFGIGESDGAGRAGIAVFSACIRIGVG